MIPLIKPLSTEITLTTANTVSGASCVRLVNTGAAVSVISVKNANVSITAGYGSFSLRANSEVLVKKTPTDTVESSASTVMAAAVGFF